ncbi:hypothetical protein DOQ08_02712 [Marinobacter litoralis]|uniref:Lipoprotein n=1 Tax=Marinobacter litoralis TaxID=187981 RepID=A0A3M2R9F3_9GAMM|nr:hypothetical protein [Marinobacter litoralis]RMJ01926.1 hypothetical protein DOQ08_02712 [Marinobacter litoralis]
MKSIVYLMAMLLCSKMLASCANMNSVISAPKDAGVSRVYEEDHELVKAAVLASMQSLNINIKETRQTSDGFSITFTKTISPFSWGEVGRVLVNKNDSTTSTVFVHSKKRLRTQVTGADEDDFEKSIFRGVLEIIERDRI